MVPFRKNQFAQGFKVPVTPEFYDRPVVIYDVLHGIALNFYSEDNKYCRVSFENLDSVRVCRGEFNPYKEEVWEEDKPIYWVSKVKNSSWLKERYKYESKHYEDSYGFSGEVKEMLTDFNHYLFRFHDEYVEVLAAGIWFEVSDCPFQENREDLNYSVSFLTLANEPYDLIEEHGVEYQLRKNSLDDCEIIENAEYCSQTLYEFSLEFEGVFKTEIYLKLRYRNNELGAVLN